MQGMFAGIAKEVELYLEKVIPFDERPTSNGEFDLQISRNLLYAIDINQDRVYLRSIPGCNVLIRNYVVLSFDYHKLIFEYFSIHKLIRTRR
jgi:hypothetical protein